MIGGPNVTKRTMYLGERMFFPVLLRCVCVCSVLVFVCMRDGEGANLQKM